MTKDNNKPIRTYLDLEVYQRLYKTMLVVAREIIPRLPKEEKFDLVDQLRRSSKAPLALIAEGFAKRYQPRAWKKYLDDAIGECNETINHLTIGADLYGNPSNKPSYDNAISEYNIANKQLFRLRQNWRNFRGETE